ncbi:MAG: hypothetical protein ACR2NL_05115, partial [Acidimicrobiia bacterium]
MECDTPHPDEQFIHDGQDHRELTGRDLRYWLVRRLHDSPEATHRVSDLVGDIIAAGFLLTGRSSKTVSDALHTETDRGRIQRVGWGRYRASGSLPTTTGRRISLRTSQLHKRLWLLYLRAGQRSFAEWRRAEEIDPALLPQPVRELRPGPRPELGIWFRPRVLPETPKVASPTENPEQHTDSSLPSLQHPLSAK